MNGSLHGKLCHTVPFICDEGLQTLSTLLKDLKKWNLWGIVAGASLSGITLGGEGQEGSHLEKKICTCNPGQPNLLWGWGARCCIIRPLVPHKGLCGMHLLWEVLEWDGFFLFCSIIWTILAVNHQVRARGLYGKNVDVGGRKSGFHLNFTAYCLWDPVWESYLTFLSFFQVTVSVNKGVLCGYHASYAVGALSLFTSSISSLFSDM